ncbi:MAG: flagellar assembly protein FliW [Mariprofundaceae bacterium]|nr:flagellar assembly protein FliW [Mariprofundaceae bacterium]
MNKALKQTERHEEEAPPFNFPQGMAGFPEAKNFSFIYNGHGDIACMQSMDHPEASLLITPWDESRLGASPSLTQEQVSCLKLALDQRPLWMLVLNPFADSTWVTANVRAPVAINMDARIGIQCIQRDPNLELRYHWIPQPDQLT